jgi:SAM-dependent methyltransferase
MFHFRSGGSLGKLTRMHPPDDDDLEFVRAQLPARGARVLDVGCGDGALALALSAAGHDVIGIDPRATPGPILRQVSLEEFTDDTPFDAAVARLSLHHIHDLSGAVDKLAGLLAPRAPLILIEFASERLRGATAEWYHHQRRALAAAGHPDAAFPAGTDHRAAGAVSELAGLHGFAAIRAALAPRFSECSIAWTPYLYQYRLHPAVEPLERTLIAAAAIEATGVRYVARRRDTQSVLPSGETLIGRNEHHGPR